MILNISRFDMRTNHMQRKKAKQSPNKAPKACTEKCAAILSCPFYVRILPKTLGKILLFYLQNINKKEVFQ